ncbi:glycerol-3-phosphate 1-O-acyltransferase PlsY [Dechloromonas sp. XY25]|uniref:Glycerol-3-phosphate acyltransferase n=1 Tax=Dechloromonas hankyongensis TaxID=2908002 RepID=A0ABS9JZN6_9RHOO|nr:glycerol-3-phosphate 1-O-acyltransferase PlsY [Dechloromonas hankyongensis]MCG2576372.1 glycerol-3-phosphate 1-O-acyltransferase PlsY [Dechloromonas hankyongensis]
MQNALALIAAYLLGSVPFAMISSKVFGLADPRTYGSGNPGATNVLRSGNKKAALMTLIGDALKGAVAVIVARQMGFSDTMIGLVALAVFVGHLYPIFLKFKGGKGVATAAGVLLALDPVLGLAVAGTWLLVAYVSRYSSLAALVAAAAAPVIAVLMHGATNQTLVVGVLGMALIGKHWQNIQRLMAGQESKIGSKKK